MNVLLLLAAVLLSACVSEADVEQPAASETVTTTASPGFTLEAPRRCGLALAPVPELLEATEVVAGRWSAATGCDVRVEAGGIPVRLATDDEMTMEDGELGRGVTSIDERGRIRFIGYRTGPLLSWTVEKTLMHEVGHALGCHAHTADGSVLDTPAPLYSKITDDALECVCASLHCEAFAPEA